MIRIRQFYFEMSHFSCTKGHVLKHAALVSKNDVLRRFMGARRVILWNDLHVEIIECDSLRVFTCGLDEVLEDKLFEVL